MLFVFRVFSLKQILILGVASALVLLTVGTASAEEAQLLAEKTGSERIIRNIQIELIDVFDAEDPDLGSFYRVVNRIKISTKKQVIRRELLFKEGEPFDKFLLEESERALRALPYLRQVSIVPIPNGSYVDILVSVQDTWTLFPQFSFSMGGGNERTEAGIVESNLLGYGQRAEIFYADDEGREKIEGVWDDRRLFGTYHRLLAAYFQRSDGYKSLVFLGRPFRSLIDRTSWNINSDFSDTVGRLFYNGDERYIYRNRHQDLRGQFIFSRGDPEKLLHRISLGYAYTNDEFNEADEQDFFDVDVNPGSVDPGQELLADDRTFSGPFISYQRIQPDYISLNYVDRFDRVEDFNLGNQLSLKLGFALDVLASDRDTLLFSFVDNHGWRISPTSFLRVEIGCASRISRLGARNSLFRGEAKYYNVLGPKRIGGVYIGKHTLAGFAAIDYGDHLDRDREFLLGAGDWLRGYKDRNFTGDKRIVFSLEDRFHLVEDVLRLISIGGAVFADAGGTTHEHLGSVFSSKFYADVGFGLRFGFPRSSGGSVMRVDLAFPVRDSPSGDDTAWKPRLFITIGQSFGARLRSESLGAENANVTVGSDR